MERSCPQSYSVARTDKAALQCVRGGSHGHGHHLALGQPDLIGPARIDPHDAGGNLVHLRFDAACYRLSSKHFIETTGHCGAEHRIA
jgi:hypothetical protein